MASFSLSIGFDSLLLVHYDLPMVDALRNFFDLNDALVFFVYGQVFFVLGLAVALQSRRHSRLALARSLVWLSLFGIVHGLHEWGQFFIPIQTSYLSDGMLSILVLIQTILLGLSFAFLFQFGVELLREKWPWLGPIPLVVTLVWGIWSAAILLVGVLPMGVWGQQHASISARYLIGFPAALVAAYGIRYQAKQQIKPLNLTQIYNMLRIAGYALVAYAFLGGLVVPAGEFFPASWLNDSLTVRWLGIPVAVFRSLAGLVIAVTIILALEVFDVEVDRLIERMELDQRLAAERERIGRELHDGAIQQAYAAGLIIESARLRAEADSVVAHRLERAVSALNQTIASLRAYMNELRPGPTSLSLSEGLRRQATDPRYATLMDTELYLALPDKIDHDPVQTTHILAIVGEGLSNAARHSHARSVVVAAGARDGQLILSIEDDGRGFNEEIEEQGYGLRNMRDRARLLGGQLSVESELGKGTRIRLTMPLNHIESNLGQKKV